VRLCLSPVPQMAPSITGRRADDLSNQQVIADLDEVLGSAEIDGQVVLNSPLFFCRMVKAA
jgi:hypothetical protein